MSRPVQKALDPAPVLQVLFRKAMKKGTVWLAILALVASHLFILLAGFFAPYSYEEQNREFPYLPPARLHLVHEGQLHRLFVYPWRIGQKGEYYEDRRIPITIRFFVCRQADGEVSPGSTGRWKLRFFGADAGEKLFLLGTDAYGRDQFSRLLFGGRVSLFTGLFAACIALLAGCIAGYLAGLGRWSDEIVMRLVELSLSIPPLYLLLAVRAVIPLKTGSGNVFALLAAIIGLTGWARPARLIRGAVLSAREREYVIAASRFGAGRFYLFRRHILPQLSGIVLTQLAVLVPQYMLVEVTLSFVGLGIDEPTPSWGNMLAPLHQYAVLENCPWMFSPAFAAIAATLAYYILSLESGADEAY